MGGEGSMLTAIKTLKANRNLLAKRKSLKEMGLGNSGETKLKFKKLTKSQMDIVMDTLKKQHQEDIKMRVLRYLLAFLCTGLTFFFLWWWLH